MACMMRSICIALAAHTAATAAVPTASAANTFSALDADGSGIVSFDEVKKFALSQGLDEQQTLLEFKDLDLNGNGSLEVDEISQTIKQVDEDKSTSSSKVAAATAAAIEPAVAAPIAAHLETVAVPEPSATLSVVKQAVAVAAAPVAAPVATESVMTTAHKTFLAATTNKTTESAVNQTALADASTIAAEKEATRIVAEQFARLAQQVLEQRNQDQDQADALELYAGELRSNATKLSDSASLLAQQAAREAAEAEIAKSQQEVQELELKATAAEEQSVQLRAQAAQALKNALAAKETMTTAVQDLSDDARNNMTRTVQQLQ